MGRRKRNPKEVDAEIEKHRHALEQLAQRAGFTDAKREAQMGDAFVADDVCTIPEELRNIPAKASFRQVMVRIHPSDHPVLKLLLRKDRLSFQRFFSYCFQGYMDADPSFLRFLKIARSKDALQAHGARDGNSHVLSHRERASIYDLLEQAGDPPKTE